MIGIFLPAKKFKRTDKLYNYAVLIPARNEEHVISQLIDSIKKQDYPAEKISVFVVAHNCTDNTAKVAREAGATVYEFSSKKQRKGVALDFLLQQIKNKYSSPEQLNGIKAFDGYFIFDADNLLAHDFVSQMNNAFDNRKYDGIVGYINMKNFGTNVIASYSSVQLYGTSLYMLRPMSFLGLSPPLRGTGALVRSDLFANGYKWHALTEDNEFSNHIISRGYRTTYCEKAVHFDEQPLSLKILARQRMRWTRGGTLLFFKCLPALLFGIIAPYHQNSQKSGKKFSLLAEFQKRMSCIDRLLVITPVWIIQFVVSVLYPITMITVYAFTGDSNWQTTMLLVILYFGMAYFNNLLFNFFTILREHRNMRIHPMRLLRHAFVWPLITIILDYVSFVAVFYPVKWKPIPHVIGKEVEQVQNEKTLAYYVYEHWDENKQSDVLEQA